MNLLNSQKKMCLVCAVSFFIEFNVYLTSGSPSVFNIVNGDGDLDGPNGSGIHLFHLAAHCIIVQCADYHHIRYTCNIFLLYRLCCHLMPTAQCLTGTLATLSIRMKRP